MWYGKPCQLCFMNEPIIYVSLCFLYGLGIFPWACIKSEISYSPWEDDSKWWSSSRLSWASSSWVSQEDHILEVWRPFGDNGHVKICINGAFPSWCMGEHLWVFTKQQWSSEAFRLEWSLKSYHGDQAGCARQRYGLARFSFYRSQGGCWETGL